MSSHIQILVIGFKEQVGDLRYKFAPRVGFIEDIRYAPRGTPSYLVVPTKLERDMAIQEWARNHSAEIISSTDKRVSLEIESILRKLNKGKPLALTEFVLKRANFKNVLNGHTEANRLYLIAKKAGHPFTEVDIYDAYRRLRGQKGVENLSRRRNR